MSNIVKFSTPMTNALVINGITIRQDEEGRYSVNDLHNAAGGEDRHKPIHWTSNYSTQELIEALKVENPTFNPLIAIPGRSGGTFACKELIYSYAMWVSPTLKIRVIRGYDRMATFGIAIHENAAQDFIDNPGKYNLELLAQADTLVKQNLYLKHELLATAHKANYYDAVKNAVNCQTVEQVAKKYGIGTKKLFKFLREKAVLRTEIGNPPYQRYLDAGYFKVEGKSRNQFGRSYLYSRTMVTGKGEIYIGKLLQEAGMLRLDEAV